LSELAKFKLIADIVGTDYVTGDLVDYGYLRNRQEYLYGEFYRKLLTKVATQICCMGDSLTNGQDTVSSDARPVSADTTHVSGEVTSGQTIASTTYPEALQSNLQSVYGTQVKVINRGYSGGWVKNGYEHYPNNHSSDLTIIMYGTNDSRATWVPDDIRGNIEDYINWYEQLIIREILWNKAVIILTPPKLANANDINIKTFAIALNALGEKYGVPVIDSAEFTANYPSTIYCDGTHFNGSGYKVFASKVTALFIGEGAKKPMLISDGETLLVRPNIDNLQYCGSATFTSSAGSQTPTEINATTGIVAQWTGTNSGIYIVFTLKKMIL
jgi:lysophospholipase L1-like esterase